MNGAVSYQYHQLPEEALLKWVVRRVNLGAVSLVLNAAEWKSMFTLIQDPQFTTEQSQMALHEPDTQEIIPEGTASLMDWIKATVKCVCPEKGDCPIPPINAKWSTPDEAVDMLRT